MKGFCTTAEAAAELGITEERVRQLAAGGRVKGAEKVGKIWLIPTDRDGRPKITLQPPGRPKSEARERLEAIGNRKASKRR